MPNETTLVMPSASRQATTEQQAAEFGKYFYNSAQRFIEYKEPYLRIVAATIARIRPAPYYARGLD